MLSVFSADNRFMVLDDDDDDEDDPPPDSRRLALTLLAGESEFLDPSSLSLLSCEAVSTKSAENFGCLRCCFFWYSSRNFLSSSVTALETCELIVEDLRLGSLFSGSAGAGELLVSKNGSFMIFWEKPIFFFLVPPAVDVRAASSLVEKEADGVEK